MFVNRLTKWLYMWLRMRSFDRIYENINETLQWNLHGENGIVCINHVAILTQLFTLLSLQCVLLPEYLFWNNNIHCCDSIIHYCDDSIHYHYQVIEANYVIAEKTTVVSIIPFYLPLFCSQSWIKLCHHMFSIRYLLYKFSPSYLVMKKLIPKDQRNRFYFLHDENHHHFSSWVSFFRI